jgi:ribosome-associated protein YbcJ (S4-like RNA binding protein)
MKINADGPKSDATRRRKKLYNGKLVANIKVTLWKTVP